MSLLAGLCVRECAGKGVCAPATCEEGWCPMGECMQAGSSWRGGGAEAEPELPCFPLSLKAGKGLS